MANNEPGSEQPGQPVLLHSPNGAAQRDLVEPESLLDFGRWWRLALRRRRLLMWSAIGAVVLVFVLTEFVMHKKYTAQTIIRPVAQADQSGIGGLLQSTGLLPQTAGQTLQNGPPDPNELVAILQSYAFTTSMVNQEHLTPKLLKGTWNVKKYIPFIYHGPPSDYAMYLLMSSRFNADLNLMSGNMTLTFIEKDPDLAQAIMELYVERLRDQVKAQTVRDTNAALRSLEEEVAKTSDPMLRDQIYELIAQEMQQVKTAEANADFAFTVLEPPYVPPIPTAPWVMIDSIAAGVLIPCLIFFWLVVRELHPRFKMQIAAADAEADRTGRDAGALVRKPPRETPRPEDDRPHLR